MFIPVPGSGFLPILDPGSRIPDPKTATKERGGKKLENLVVIPFFLPQIHKIENYFVFDMLKKIIWANFQITLSKWVLDPGSGKNLFRIPDQGVKKASDPGSRSGSATLTNRLQS